MLAKLLAFLAKDWEQARSYRLGFILQFGGAGITLVGLYFMNRLFRSAELEPIQQYGGDYVAFILIGLVVTLYSGTTLRAFATSLRQAQVMGTLEALLLTRARLSTIMFGWAIYPLLQATMSVVIFMLGGFLILDASFENANIIGALVTMVLTLGVMVGLGIIAASVTLITKQSDPFTRILVIAAGMLSGALYPVSSLPGWLQSVAQLLPHTHAIEAIRLTVLQGASLQEIAPQLAALALYVAIVMPLSIWSFKYAMRRVRIEGSLSHY